MFQSIEEKKAFVPLITSDKDSGVKAAKVQTRVGYEMLLGIDACAEAVSVYKGNGSVKGHKVLDDGAAVEALLKAAPSEMVEKLNAISYRTTVDNRVVEKPLTDWERVQILNQVLRKHYEMDKSGKLTGNPSKRVLLAREKAAVDITPAAE
jgi:hypothetical protein